MTSTVQCQDLPAGVYADSGLAFARLSHEPRGGVCRALALGFSAFVAIAVLLALLSVQPAIAAEADPGDVAEAAAVAAAAAIAAAEYEPPADSKDQIHRGQSNSLSKLSQCLRSYPCGMWVFVGALACVLVATAILLIHSANGATDIPTLPTSFFFWLGIGYLVLLLLIGAFYVVQRGTSPAYMLGGLLPIAVPWFGALGAVIISLAGVFFYSNQNWDNKFNYWHIGRPLFGAVVGIVAFFIFIIIVVSAGTDIPIFAPKPKPREFIIYYVLAFLVGYREETFRELIRRVTDLILKPGSTPAVDSSSVSFKQSGQVITTANVGVATVSLPAKSTIDIENAGKTALKYPAVHLENGSAQQFSIAKNQLVGVTELAPGASKSVEITLTVTAAGNPYVGALIVTGANLKATRLALTGQS